MAINSPVLTVLLVIFAIIGALVVLALLGMVFMHGGMMGMMGSPAKMIAACTTCDENKFLASNHFLGSGRQWLTA